MMLTEIMLAIGVSLIAMVVVGTIVRQILGLRSLINWFIQTAVLFGLASVAPVGPVAISVMVVFPTGIHLVRHGLLKLTEYRAANGHYGEEAKWAYELMQDDDDFTRAQYVLPQDQVREVSIIADSKQEMRDLMIDRYNELVSEELNDNADKFKL